jgi:hypothetical protein
MVLDRTLIPPKLQKGPAVGFLYLSESLPLLRLAAPRVANWDTIHSILEDLDCELRETLNLQDIDHDIVTELIIHRDRVTFTLDAWKRGYYTEDGLKWLIRQEQNLRTMQREIQKRDSIERDSVIGKRVRRW